MTAVDLPEEPPVGTTLTAPRMDHLYVRTEKSWYVASQLGNLLLPDAPGADWASVVRILDAYGGILTVTTEYEIEYRFVDDEEPSASAVMKGFVSRDHVRRWAASMRGANAVELLRVQSQRVTRSAWTDEPLKDPT